MEPYPSTPPPVSNQFYRSTTVTHSFLCEGNVYLVQLCPLPCHQSANFHFHASSQLFSALLHAFSPNLLANASIYAVLVQSKTSLLEDIWQCTFESSEKLRMCATSVIFTVYSYPRWLCCSNGLCDSLRCITNKVMYILAIRTTTFAKRTAPRRLADNVEVVSLFYHFVSVLRRKGLDGITSQIHGFILKKHPGKQSWYWCSSTASTCVPPIAPFRSC